ncbi:hypothetical protein ACTHQ2_22660 [Bacillus subtilis]|uniref:hypothetical protein n=1 Tax=Bacillus subtilis TaxID=1423 RepID=UPI003F7C06AE
MGTKAYSTRLDPEFDQVERELALILDLLDTDETGQINSGQWLREAARRRIKADQENEETLDSLVTIASTEPIQQQSEEHLFDLDIVPNNLLEEHAFSEIIHMDLETRKEWIKQAVLMRFALENDPCAYIVNRWIESDVQTETVSRGNKLQLDSSSEMTKENPDTGEPAILIETTTEQAEGASEPIADELTPYRTALTKLMTLEWGYD